MEYGVCPRVFLALYLLSFLPYHAGLYLVVTGSGAIQYDPATALAFDWRNADFGCPAVVWGFALNRLGWLLPYLYLEWCGRNLPWWLHGLVVLWFTVTLVVLVL